MSATKPIAPSFYLPDLLSLSTPFIGAKNPHYERAAAESRAWVAKHTQDTFDDQERVSFAMGCSELLVANTYPHAEFVELRTVCDLVNLLFVIDEVSDKQSGADARETGNVYLSALRDADWDDGSVISRMTKEFRARFMLSCGPRSFERFLQYNTDYVACVAREAELREAHTVLSPPDYRDLRRENSAVRVCFGLFEYTLGIDLPDEVFENDTFKAMYFAAVDMVCWANDVYSYDMEQAKGHTGNNIVTVLMQAHGFSLQAASSHIGEAYAEFMRGYLSAKAQLRYYSFGDVQLDLDVVSYIEAMENWPIGNINWSFESGRYFPKPEEVKRTGLVVLRQPKYDDGSMLSETST
ncbi:terpenoid synthase [Peniophora sp. CONT]|nr:terpenoid synthase [Peniophora sp. CONT]